MALILTRRDGERIMIGDSITITVVRSIAGRVGLAIDAPADVPVDREEVRESKRKNAPSARGTRRWALSG